MLDASFKFFGVYNFTTLVPNLIEFIHMCFGEMSNHIIAELFLNANITPPKDSVKISNM